MNKHSVHELIQIIAEVVVEVAAAWPSGTASGLQILHDWFDSRLELIENTGGCCLEKRKLTLRPPSITIEFLVQYNLKITSVFCFFIYIEKSTGSN